MRERLFTPPDDQSLQSRAIVPQMDERSSEGAGLVASTAARALLGLSQEMADLEQARVRAESAAAEASARARLTVGMAELRRSLTDGDPSTIRDRWQQGTAALRQLVRESVPERHRARVDRLAEQMAASETGAVLDLQTRRTGEVGRASLLQSLDDLVRAAVAASDPDERERITGQIDAALLGAVSGGLIGAEAGERMRQRTRQRLDRETARALVRARPGGGPQVVDELPLPPLPPEAMESLRDEATANLAAVGVEDEAAMQQVVKSRQEVAARIVNAALGGEGEQPSVDDVMALRHDIEPATFDAVLTVAFGRAATRDDPQELDDLTAAVGAGRSAQVRGRLDRSLAARLITPETHRRLSALDLELRAETPAARARRAERETLRQAFIDLDRIDGIGIHWQDFVRFRTGAFDAWEEWRAANPQATPQQRREALDWTIAATRRDIVSHALMTLPRPGGLRLEPGRAPRLADLDRLEGELLDALDGMAESLDAGDAAVATGIADELELIERWRVIAGYAEDAERAAPGGQKR
jgi:surface antigen